MTININKHCPICNMPMKPLFRHELLSKYDVDYFLCEQCDLIQTEEPFWLNEAYERAISLIDTGILHRNLRIRRYLEPLIELFDLGHGTFADVGGGYGTLTRLMRDIGYDFNTHDPYCKNIFSQKFEVRTGAAYDALLAFEVIEHLRDPLDFLKTQFSTYSTKTIFLSTNTYRSVPGETWWYYAFDTGQHISFYKKETLSLIAKKVGCSCYSITDSIHVITDRKVNYLSQLIMKNKPLLLVYAILTRMRRARKTKIFEDHEYLKVAMKGGSNNDNNQDDLHRY